MCYSSLFKWFNYIIGELIAKDNLNIENLMQTFENPFLQNSPWECADCTDYPCMDIIEFLGLKEICKFSNNHLKITTLNQYHALAA